VSLSVPGLVALLYRADWTQLSLSATVTWSRDRAVDRRLFQRKMSELRELLGPLPRVRPVPSWDHHDEDDPPRDYERRVLLAPGARYRVEASDGSPVSIADGEYLWEIDEDAAERTPAAGPDQALHGLVTPQWLLACYDLDIIGDQNADGRPAIRVLGRPRAIQQRRRRGVFHLLDRVEVLVDAELGILLRSEQIFEGLTRSVAELRNLVVNPAETAEPGRFAPPPGMPVTDGGGLDGGGLDDRRRGGLGWQVAGTAASLTADAMGFAVRHAPRRRTTRPSGDDQPDMPREAQLSAAEWAPQRPPADALINLLHRTALPAPALAAQLHQWIDGAAMMHRANTVRAQLPPPLQGLLGPDALWDAMGERMGDYGGHKVARLRVRTPDLYRLDYLSGDWGKPYKSIACDGEHVSKLFDNRVATGPVKPLDADLAALLDPAWLLSGWRLLAVSPVQLSGRAGFRLLAEVTGTADDNADNIFTRVEAVVDAELGILLRQTTYVGEHPATRTELRDLTVRGGDAAADFRIEPTAGMHAVADSGGPLADRNLPRAAEAATMAATLAVGGAVAGAVAVTGWLEKHRARRGQD
jgi:hypothetical protein